MENTRRLKLTRAPAPPGSDGSTESGRQRSVASKENNAADAVFHGIIYKRGVETNRWVELSRGFAKLMIRRDLTSRRGAIIVAQEGAIQPISMPVASDVKVKRRNLFIQWSCNSGGLVTHTVYGVYFPKQEEAVEFERSLFEILQSERDELLQHGEGQSLQQTQVNAIQPKEIAIKVHLPAKQTTTVAVSPNMSVHDFLLYVCKRRHLMVSSHGLSLPPDCPGKCSQQFDGSTTVGSLGTYEVHIVQLCNGDASGVKFRSSTSSQSHLLLQVYLPRDGEKTTVSVCPDMLVRDLLTLICEKRGLNPSYSSLELVRSTSRKREIDIRRRVGDLKVNEIKLVDKRELNGRGAVSSSTTWNSSKPGSFSREKVHVNAVQHGKQQPSKHGSPSSRGCGHTANVLTPEWEQFFAIGGVPFSEVSDPAVAETVNNLVTKHGGLEAVLRDKTALSSVLTQFSEYLSLRRRQEASAYTSFSPTTQSSGRPRKKAAPPPPVVQYESPRMLSAASEPSSVMSGEIRSQLRASSTPIPFRVQKSPKNKGRAPPPPKKLEQIGDVKGLASSSVSAINNSDSLKSTSIVAGTPSVGGGPCIATVVRCPSYSPTATKPTAENGAQFYKEDTKRPDNDYVSGIVEHIGATGFLAWPDVDLVDSSTDAFKNMASVDMPPPPPPVVNKCVPCSDDIEDLPPPPMGLDQEFPWAMAYGENEDQDEDGMPLPPEPVSEKHATASPSEEYLDSFDRTVKPPSDRQDASGELVQSAFDMEMDELYSILDSVVAEAEAYLTSPEVRPEPPRAKWKDTATSQGKFPPPVAQKPKIFSRPGTKSTKLLLLNQANKQGTDKPKVANLPELNNPAFKKGQQPPPKPIPYALSPAGKRRLIQTRVGSNSTTGNTPSWSTSKVVSYVNATDRPKDITRNRLTSYKHKKGSVTPSPRLKTQFDQERPLPVPRGRSNSLPICPDLDEKLSSGPPPASSNFLLSDSTGTIRGVKGQVKTRVGTLPDIPNDGIVDETVERCHNTGQGQVFNIDRDLPIKRISRSVSPRQPEFGCQESALAGNEDGGPLKNVQSLFLLPSVGRKQSTNIVFKVPPPPPFPPSPSPSPPPLPPCEPHPISTPSCLQETNQPYGSNFVPDCSWTLTPAPSSAERVPFEGIVHQTGTSVSLALSSPPVESIANGSIDEDDMSGVSMDISLAPETKVVTDCYLSGDALDYSPLTSAAIEMGDVDLDQACTVTNSGLPTKEAFQLDFDDGASAAITSKGNLLNSSSLSPPDKRKQAIGLDMLTSGGCDPGHEQSALQCLLQTTTEEASQHTGITLNIHGEANQLDSSPLKLLLGARYEAQKDFQLDSSGIVTDRPCLLKPPLQPRSPGVELADGIEMDMYKKDVSPAREPSKNSSSPLIPCISRTDKPSTEAEPESHEEFGLAEKDQLLWSQSIRSSVQIPMISNVERSASGEFLESLDQSRLALLSATMEAGEVTDQSISSPPLVTPPQSPMGVQKGFEVQDKETVGRQSLWEPAIRVPLSSEHVAVLHSFERPLSPGLGCSKSFPQAVNIAEECAMSPSSDLRSSVTFVASKEPALDVVTCASAGTHFLINDEAPSAGSIGVADKTLPCQLEPPPGPENPPPLPLFGSNVDVETLSGSRSTVLEMATACVDSDSPVHERFPDGHVSGQYDHSTTELLAAFTSPASSERHPNTTCCHDVRTSITDVNFESDARLVKARSEVELLSGNDAESLASYSSGGSLSPTDASAVLTCPRNRPARTHRWNSDLDLPVLHSPYRGAYGEVLTDIKKGNNFARLRKVKTEPRRKSLPTTLTGMAAAIADAMKTRRIRLTDSLESSNRQSIVQEDQEEETWDFNGL